MFHSHSSYLLSVCWLVSRADTNNQSSVVSKHDDGAFIWVAFGRHVWKQVKQLLLFLSAVNRSRSLSPVLKQRPNEDTTQTPSNNQSGFPPLCGSLHYVHTWMKWPTLKVLAFSDPSFNRSYLLKMLNTSQTSTMWKVRKRLSVGKK